MPIPCEIPTGDIINVYLLKIATCLQLRHPAEQGIVAAAAEGLTILETSEYAAHTVAKNQTISNPSSFWHRGLELSGALKDGFQSLGLAPDEKVWSESFCLCHSLHDALLHHLQIWEKTWYRSNK